MSAGARLQDKVALITGGASGIGLAIVAVATVCYSVAVTHSPISAGPR